MNLGSLLAVLILALVVWYLWPKQESWIGFVYPDGGNLIEFERVGKYPSLDDCRHAVLDRIRMMDDPNNADYECGLNCESSDFDEDLMICERTEE